MGKLTIVEFKARKGNCRCYDDKELIRKQTCVGLKDGKIRQAVEARWYMGRSKSASVVYCNVYGWGVAGEQDVSISGAGSAGGGGYCKQSAAMHYALCDAGVVLSESIAGRGDSAIREAMFAIAEAFGFSDIEVF